MSYESLESAVQTLVATNSALVDAVTGTQQEASTAIIEANQSAVKAKASETEAGRLEILSRASADIAVSKASEASASAIIADTKAIEAANSAATAAAVVTGGTASLSPEAGKIPLAGADGKIDLQWLGPNIAARLLMSGAQINHIGIPGTVGFGVGICPEVPEGYSALAGTYAPGSAEYGNYQYADGSIMVWIPAYYERIGHPDNPTYDRYGSNSIDIKPLAAFADRAAAALQGYSLPRAFIDGGEVVPGFMRDKYGCSNNNGVASSIKNAPPLSSHAAHNPFSELNGAPANNYGGAFQAAKTRGEQFFPASRFMTGALAGISMATAQAATNAETVAWFDAAGVINFPKGNNNNALRDTNDNSVTFTHDGYGNSALTGSGVPFAKTTHNGQECGVADVNGNMYRIEPGLTCVARSISITGASQADPVALTVTGHGLSTGDMAMVTSMAGMTQVNNRIFTITVVDADTVTLDGVDGTGFDAYESGGSLTAGQFYIAKESTRFKDFTGGASLATDHFGATGVAAMMQPIKLEFRTDYPNNGAVQRFGNGSNQVLDPSIDGDGWLLRSLGLPQDQGASTAGSSLFGSDYFYQYIRNELCLLSGLNWSYGTNAGVWAVDLGSARGYSGGYVGFCAASYPVRPNGSEA